MNVIGFKLQPARYVSWFFLLPRAKGLGTPCFGFHLNVCVTVAENEREQCRNIIMVTFGSEGPAISSTIETSSSSETANCAPKDFFCSFLLRKSQLRDQTVYNSNSHLLIFLGASSFELSSMGSEVLTFFLPFLGDGDASSMSTSITASESLAFLLLPLLVGVEEADSASMISSSSSTRMGRAGVTGARLSASCTSEDLTDVCLRALPVGVAFKSFLGVFLWIWITPPSGATSRSGSTPESRRERREGVNGVAEGVKGVSEREDRRTRLERKSI